jgi:hypothetical protein
MSSPETERFAIERRDACGSGRRGCVQVGGALAKDLFNFGRVQPLENISNGGMGKRPSPAEPHAFQFSPMDFDEGSDAAIGIGPAHNRQNGKQQDVRELIKFALGAPRAGIVAEESVASHRFRTSRPKEPPVSRCVSNL